MPSKLMAEDDLQVLSKIFKQTHSIFCTCSRIFSISLFIASAFSFTIMLLVFEAIVLASRLNS